MPRFLGYKIKDRKTGLFMGPGVIGTGRWTKVGRTWSSKGALSGSIGVWLERINRSYRWSKTFRDEQERASHHWVVVALSADGVHEQPFMDYVTAKLNKSPLPSPECANPLRFSPDEIELVEETLRGMGDADEAGELTMRVLEALKRYEK